ncbi:MAG: glycerophosphodiester phosphodiesterase [Planctomycetota bacterium]|jgi:glycerophosphoryl diester phosphodiesterase
MTGAPQAPLWSRRSWQHVVQELRCSAGEVRRLLPTLIGLNVMTRVLMAALALPALAWVGERLVRTGGDFAVSNFEIVTFLLTPAGLALLVVIGVGQLTLLFAQIAAVILVVGSSRLGTRLSLLSVLRRLARLGPGLMRLGAVLLGTGVLVVAPFAIAALAAVALLLGEHDINYYLGTRPRAFRIAMLIVGLLGLGAALSLLTLFLRWIHALSAMLFESLPPRAALRRSRLLTRGWRARTTCVLLAWAASLLLLSTSVGVATFLLRHAVLAAAGTHLALVIPAVSLLSAVELMAALAVAFVADATLCVLMTSLYFEARERVGEPIVVRGEKTPADATHHVARSRRLAVWTVIAGIFATTIGVSYAIANDVGRDRTVAITAHRGSSMRAPENTLAAIEAAIVDGADYVEIDVQETRDGVIVLLHDTDLQRVAGINRNIWDLNAAELGDIDVGSWFDPSFASERIPTLEQVIASVRGRIKLNIELKYNGRDVDLAGRVVRLVQREQFQSHSIIMSLNADGLRQVRALDPTIPIGMTVGASLGDLSRLDVDFLSVGARQTNHDLLAAARRAGQEVHVWTVNSPEQALRFIALRADNIITDDPAMVVAVRAEWDERPLAEQILVAFRYALSR